MVLGESIKPQPGFLFTCQRDGFVVGWDKSISIIAGVLTEKTSDWQP